MESLPFLRENETYDDFYKRCSNLSLFDCSEEEMLWLMMGSQRLPLSEIVPWSIVLVVIFLTGVVGNVCVCVIIVRNPGLHTATNYYLFSLAVSDLLLLLFGSSFTVSKMQLFEEWVKHTKSDRNKALFMFVLQKHDLSGVTEASVKDMKTIISRFSSKLSEKWENSIRIRDRFLACNAKWLEGEDLQFNVSYDLAKASTSSHSLPGPGRPPVDLANASAKTKRRRVDDLVQLRSSELLFASEIASRQSGKRNVAKLIREVSESPEKFSERKSSDFKQQRCLTSDEALAYYKDSKSTGHAYKQTRKWSMLAGHQVFPSFHSLRKAKKACLPPDEHVTVTETRAEIKLQAVLDKTVQRLISVQREVITACSSGGNSGTSFTLVSKWGCDGSSGHSTYKQQITNSGDTDEFLFVFSFFRLFRIATNTDLLNMLIITSDPVINSLRDIPKKKSGSLPSAVLDLVCPPVNIVKNVNTVNINTEDYCIEDSSEDELSDDE